LVGTVAGRIMLKRALLLIVIGLIVELFCLVHITPPTFLLFAFFGVGPIVIGLALFFIALARVRREGDRG
jgi:hypothetical protein